MKLAKVLLLVSATILMACSPTASTSESKERTPSSSVTSTSSVESTSENTSSISTSSSESSSSISSSSSSATSSSDAPVADNELTINFYNPTCNTMSTEVLDERLAAYMNEVAGTTFVSKIKNTACQMANDIPTNGDKILIIGSAKAAGSLEFTFANDIKSVVITAQTYCKAWVDTWSGDEPVTYMNVDANSVLTVNEHTVDLKPTDDQAVEKEHTEALNGKTLKLSTSGENNSRVFIKSIKFIY